MKILRHGDLSFHAVKEAPFINKIKNDGTFVLALSEHTGHKHVITKEEGTMEIGKDANGDIFLVIDGRAVLTHQEHNPIEFTTGVYHMKKQREYDPFQKIIDYVAD